MAAIDTTGLRPSDSLGEELAGLDRLEQAHGGAARGLARLWAATWPKLAAIGLALRFWEVVVWSGWRPEFLLPPPGVVFGKLWEDMQTARFWEAIGNTMQRAIVGYALALVVGGLLGIAVARVHVLRVAIGSLITGLQTMPSIAW